MAPVGDVYEYLRHLGLNVWIKLYRGNATFLSIFRSFTELEQLVVFRLLFLVQPVSERALRLWFKPGSANELNITLSRLVSCHALTITPSQVSSSAGERSTTVLNQYRLQEDFREGLLRCVLHKDYNEVADKIVPLDIQALNPELYKDINKSTLFDFSRHKWELILRYIVSIEFRKKVTKSSLRMSHDSDGSNIIADDIVTVLKRHKLVFKPSQSTVSQAFQTVGMSRQSLSWLLRDIRSQINSLILEFIYLYDMGNLTKVKMVDDGEDGSNHHQDESTASEPAKPDFNLEEAEKNVTEIISFILTLSQLAIGQPISSKGLTKPQKRFLAFAVDLGVLWQPSMSNSELKRINTGIQGLDADKIYFAAPHVLLFRSHISEPASLVSAISTADFATKKLEIPSHYFCKYLIDSVDVNAPRMKHNLESGIIVQSNFKVYVYTASPLQINVLAHLCELQSRTPNLVIGVLTRASAHAAFRAGISAQQICRFLETHSHPILLQNSKQGESNLPNNVVTQLKMWEAERSRLVLEPCVLIKNWENEYLPDLFQHTVRWAESKKYLLHYTAWPENSKSEEFKNWMLCDKYLACKGNVKDEVIEFIRSLKEYLNSENKLN